MQIRDAQPADSEALVELLVEMGYKRRDLAHVPGFLGGLAQRTSDRVLVADDGGDVVGLAGVAFADLLVHPARSCRLVTIVVRSDKRRSGIGRALLEAAELAAREAGCQRIELTVVHENEGALTFYRDAGWTETGLRFKRVFDD